MSIILASFQFIYLILGKVHTESSVHTVELVLHSSAQVATFLKQNIPSVGVVYNDNKKIIHC